MRIGLVADTHGFLGEDVLAALEGCEHILHAGDIGPGVVEPLARIAPVTAVRGNNDTSGPQADLPAIECRELAGFTVAVVHRLVDAPPPAWDLLVFGHCHRQHAYWDADRLLLNPGAAGRRGFHRQRSVAILDLLPGEPPAVDFIDLGLRAAALKLTAAATR